MPDWRESLIDDDCSLRLSALEKLHFFDGVRIGWGADATGGVAGLGLMGEDMGGTSRETVRSGSSVAGETTGKARFVEDGSGDLYGAKSLGRGGTGGTGSSSTASTPWLARLAVRSRRLAASLDCTLETSLPALFRLFLLKDDRIETADVALVLVDNVVESRELVVGVPVKLAEDADPRFGVKLERAFVKPSLLPGRRPVRPGVTDAEAEGDSCVESSVCA